MTRVVAVYILSPKAHPHFVIFPWSAPTINLKYIVLLLCHVVPTVIAVIHFLPTPTSLALI